MSDVRALKVLITSSYDPQGSQQATENLKGIGKATEQAGEHAEGFNVHGREMRKLFGELDRIAPGLGESLHGLVNPSAAGIVAVLVVLKLLTSEFEKWKKQHEEMAALSGDLWRAQFEGARKAVDAFQDYAEVINKLPSDLDDLNKKYKETNTLLTAQIAARKTILEQIEKELLAAAGGDKSKEEEIKRRFEGEKRSFDLAGEQQQLTNLQFERGQAAQDREQAFRAADAAEITKENNSTKPDDVTRAEHFISNKKSDFEAANQYLTQNGGTIDDAKKDVQNIRDQHGGLLTGFGQGLQDDIDTVEKYQAAQKTVADWADTVKNTDAAAKKTLEQWKALNAKVEELSEQIETSKGTLAIHSQTAQRQSAFDRVDAAGGFGNAENILSAGVAAEAAIQSGHAVTKQMADQIATMHALFDAVGGNGTAIINILRQSLAHHTTQQQEINQLKTQFANLLINTQHVPMRGSPTGQ